MTGGYITGYNLPQGQEEPLPVLFRNSDTSILYESIALQNEASQSKYASHLDLESQFQRPPLHFLRNHLETDSPLESEFVRLYRNSAQDQKSYGFISTTNIRQQIDNDPSDLAIITLKQQFRAIFESTRGDS